MANITAYDTANGKRYRVRYRKPDGAQTDPRGFTTKREAELFAATIHLKKASGEYIDPQDAKITIGTLGERWLAGLEAIEHVSLRVRVAVACEAPMG